MNRRHRTVECNVLHRNYKVVQIDQVVTKEHGSYEMVLHFVFRKIKRILRNVFDLKNVRIGFSADATTTINKFLLEVSKILSLDCKQLIFFVVADGPFILYAGTL